MDCRISASTQRLDVSCQLNLVVVGSKTEGGMNRHHKIHCYLAASVTPTEIEVHRNTYETRKAQFSLSFVIIVFYYCSALQQVRAAAEAYLLERR